MKILRVLFMFSTEIWVVRPQQGPCWQHLSPKWSWLGRRWLSRGGDREQKTRLMTPTTTHFRNQTSMTRTTTPGATTVTAMTTGLPRPPPLPPPLWGVLVRIWDTIPGAFQPSPTPPSVLSPSSTSQSLSYSSSSCSAGEQNQHKVSYVNALLFSEFLYYCSRCAFLLTFLQFYVHPLYSYFSFTHSLRW